MTEDERLALVNAVGRERIKGFCPNGRKRSRDIREGPNRTRPQGTTGKGELLESPGKERAKGRAQDVIIQVKRGDPAKF